MKILLTILFILTFLGTAEAITPVARTEITHASDGSFQDVDVTAYVDAGNTAGVVLEVDNVVAGTNYWGLKVNGATGEVFGALNSFEHTFGFIGIDDNDIFELWMTDASDFNVYIVGYILDTEGYFLTEPLDVSVGFGDVGSWIDVDITDSTVGDDVAIAAFVFFDSDASGFRLWGLRENGSTDERYKDANWNLCLGNIVGVDEGEIFEQKIEMVDCDTYVTGYLTDSFTSFTNGKDYSGTTYTAYTDVDFSSDIPSGNNGATFEFYNSSFAADDMHMRKNGESYTSQYEYTTHQFGWCEIDGDRVAEQYIQDSTCDLYLLGYTNTYSAPAVGAPQVIIIMSEGKEKEVEINNYRDWLEYRDRFVRVKEG